MRFSNIALAAFSFGSAIAAPAAHQNNARALEILATATATVGTVKSSVDVELKSICMF